ncbi:MAG: TonB-dependent receptor [Lentimicrobium sp.]|jgi:TonB-linked SusC/RagA family outer membrane protein|nr:TonB-dependent receptor [Lentimicrobium sp.]
MKKTRILAKAILLTFFLTMFALNTSAQKVTLSFQNETFEKVLNTIKQQTSLSLVFSEQLVDLNRRVSINANSIELKDALQQLLKGTNLSYEIKNNKLYLIEKKNTEQKISVNPSKKITGLVTDEKGDPIIGASVVIKGSSKGTITNLKGEFSIEVEDNQHILVSYIGYITVDILAKSNQKIVLKEENKNLSEIVVVGYGTQKKVNLTGSVATLSSDKLTIAPLTSTSNTLAGRLPGLITKQQSGLPGMDASYLSIRGFDSPLIIVDGIESALNNIDANEIESLSVLKDASAAIYGARAGNGVILVSTKRGKSEKPTITLNSSTTYQAITNMLKPASSGQNAEMIRELHLQAGMPEATSRFTQEQVDLFYSGTNPDYANTNWLNVVTRPWSPQQQHNLSVRGGTDKMKYYGFFGFVEQQSMFKNNGGEYQRYNVRSNVDAKILENLNLQVDLSSIVENRDFPWRGDENANSVWQDFWNTEPYFPSTLPDPTKLSYANGAGTGGVHITTNSDISGYKRTNSQNITGSLSLKYDFNRIKGLSAKAFANYKQDYSFSKTFQRLVETWVYENTSGIYTSKGGASNPFLTHHDSRSRMITGQFSLNYDRIFAQNHNISVLALYEVIDYSSDWISAGRVNYITSKIDYLFAGGVANQISNGSAWEMGRKSLISRLNYSYKSKYLLESTLRSDESAKFDKDHRRGLFPSVSAGWRITEESFIKDKVSWLENLKLRGSYSQTGNDAVGNFQYLSGYQLGQSYIFGTTPSVGIIETALANNLLTWETMTISNVGIDFGLRNKVLYGEIDAFYRVRDGIPGTRSASLPSTFGASLPIENINILNDRGFEFMLGHQGKINDFSWDLSANISWSRSKWQFFDEPTYDDPDNIRLYQRTGQWTDIAFGYKSDGLFASQAEIDALKFVYNETQGNTSLKPGDIRYKDTNEDGLLNWRDQVEIGKGAIPHWMGGLNISLKYNNFDFSALTQGAFGFYHYVVLQRGGVLPEIMFTERWTYANNNTNALVPRLGGANTNDLPSDYRYIAADYLRLKTVSIGYNLPKKVLDALKIKNLRFYAVGTNLFTFSKLNNYGIDPEAPSGSAGMYYPQMKTVTCGINLSF